MFNLDTMCEIANDLCIDDDYAVDGFADDCRDVGANQTANYVKYCRDKGEMLRKSIMIYKLQRDHSGC
jgi:hypothetical protein